MGIIVKFLDKVSVLKLFLKLGRKLFYLGKYRTLVFSDFVDKPFYYE